MATIDATVESHAARALGRRLQSNLQTKLQDKLQSTLLNKLQNTLQDKLQNTEYVHNAVDVDDVDARGINRSECHLPSQQGADCWGCC